MGLIVLSLLTIRPFFSILIIGSLLAFITHPLYRKILTKIHQKTLAAIIVCILVLLILIVPLIILIKLLVNEAFNLFLIIKETPAIDLFQSCESAWCDSLKSITSNHTVQNQIQELGKNATNWIVQKGTAVLISVPRMMLNLVVLFFTLFYFLKDGESVVEKISSYGTINQQKYQHLRTRLHEIVKGIVYGYLLIAILQGILGGVGFLIFGITAPLLWGLVMGILALIPMAGTGFVWVPASLILFLSGLFQGSTGLIARGIGLFLYGLIIISGVDNFLRPKLMGATAKVHPAIILLGTMGGIIVFGPLGVIIGPLILAITEVALSLYSEEKLPKES